MSKIVQETNAILILSSSWKIGWEPKGKYITDRYNIYGSTINYHAKYLDNHLKKKGKLVLADKTRERNLSYRGMGIKTYLSAHPEITDWIVLDDEIFIDFKERGIIPHLVKTDSIWGLTDDDAEAAIKMLNGQIIGPYIAKSKDKNIIDSNNPLDCNVITEKDAGPTNGTEK